ncbi:NAD-dependent DNA ligase LigA [Mycoplasma miroungirhinis]|uniref:DNA ligase n=1 Tax=Mycoplasma miroungirhinis TaxID=754516 RepID=A0A6M4JCT4_9MOLU|nr:NAD-dependent DNA ligase LigA [Mycoplasma miroungirhinis]QJR44088.1 NAD-dependent DNA ligase LigA [Mycoplasma miroungirhinis]
MENNDFKKIKQEIEQLQNQIQIWNNAYFNLDDPLVEDAIYDKEIIKLKNLEQKYGFLFTENELAQSPTQIIGSSASNAFQKVTHDFPMLSLQKSYEKEELEHWIENINKVTINASYFIEPKIDGLSISLKYKNGKLIQAVTRGDGYIGEDVTHNILTIKELPKTIDYLNEIEIRGEVYLKLSEFEKINYELKKENKQQLANPRNAASGSLRQLNPEITKKRNLSIFLYSIQDPDKHQIYKISQIRQWLKKHNFPTTNEGEIVHNINEIITWINNFKLAKTLLDYETDGIVIKLNEIKYYNLLGTTQKFPRYAIAYKYEPNTATTVLKNIFITVGRTGMITYNGTLESVFLGGSNIQAATLHNYDYIKKLKIDVGDLVYIKKAGEIIPKVISTVHSKSHTNFQKILYCPFCHNLLEESETGIDQFCVNENCPEINLKKLIHFTSKTAMDILTLGEKNIEILFKLGFINSFSDIYKLKDKYDELIKMERFGVKSVHKMLESIEKSKTQNLSNLIHAISIKLIGEKISYFLASKILEFKNLLTFDFDSLINYHEIGDKIVNSLKEFVANANNQKMIQDLVDIGLNLKYTSQINSLSLMNYSFVITGTLTQPRSTIEKLLITKGAKISNSVTKNTSYLLIGEKPGSKLAKAKALNINIITEEQLVKEILKEN